MNVLWDIDGTLLRQNIYAPQRLSLLAALGEVCPPARHICEALDWVGRTDRWILQESLRRAGVPDLDARLASAEAAYLDVFTETCPASLEDEARPELLALLEETQIDFGFVSVPVTGNLRTVAMMKLRRAGYMPFLKTDSGGYGEDGTERRDIVVTAARRLEGPPYVLVGDTPRDIEAARAVGIRVIAWETEKHYGQLGAADFVARNEEQLFEALQETLAYA